MSVLEVKVGNTRMALIDAEDYEKVSAYKWWADDQSHRSPYGTVYAFTKTKRRGGIYIQMHRLIMDFPKGLLVDHINHNGLDNRKVNLRLATSSQNQFNQRKRRSKSKYKGVTWNGEAKKWQARISPEGKTIYLGFFTNEVDAGLAYANAANLYFGEFAYREARHD